MRGVDTRAADRSPIQKVQYIMFKEIVKDALWPHPFLQELVETSCSSPTCHGAKRQCLRGKLASAL
jgi:hypothetical protein